MPQGLGLWGFRDLGFRFQFVGFRVQFVGFRGLGMLLRKRSFVNSFEDARALQF